MLKIGKKNLAVPLIQGGMGIGVSMGQLAGAVAKCGGMGVVSSVNVGFRSPHFVRNPVQSNRVGLMQEICRAKDRAGGKGLIAVNIMMADRNSDIQVVQAVNSGVDCIIAGAGLPVKLPELLVGTGVALAPIVSSGKALDSLCRYWARRSQRFPDFVIVEGPDAGGHLGFDLDELAKPPTLEDLLADVLEVVRPMEPRKGQPIPVFMAGGVTSQAQIERLQSMGAAGVQLGTRFIATHECDACQEFKEMYVRHSSADLEIIKSPAGMPGRAIHSNLVTAIKKVGRIPPNHCVQCLRTCEPAKTHFCISRALAEAQRGNEVEGLFFAGKGIDSVKEITSVEAVFDEMMPDWRTK